MRKNKKIFLTTFFTLYLSATNVFSQTLVYNEPILIKRIEKSGSSIDSMSEYGFEIAKILKANSDLNLIIRLCSNEKLPVAVGTSAVDPISFTWFLMNAETLPKFSIEQIFVELSPTCQKSGSQTTATELVVTANSQKSENIQIAACRIRSVEYKYYSEKGKPEIIGTKKYQAAFNKLNADIDSGLQDNGLIIAYHNIGSSKPVLKKLNRLKSHLNNVDSKKLFFGKLDWNREDSVGQIKNVVIKAIRIEPECSNEPTLPEIIYFQ